MNPGLPVTLYDEDIRCQGSVREGVVFAGEWVAEIIFETIVDLADGDFEDLQARTKQAALTRAGGSQSAPGSH